MNEMKHSGGLVSQLNVCDRGEETKDGGGEVKTDNGKRGNETGGWGWGVGGRLRDAETGSVRLQSRLSVCPPVALHSAVMECRK